MPPLTDALRDALAGRSGPALWRSLEELADGPDGQALLAAEFPDVLRSGKLDRRTVLALLGAALAPAGLGACDGPVPENAPLLSPARSTPGIARGEAVQFATVLDRNGYGFGALATAQDARVIRIDGNPLHPASLGAADVFVQAELLSLYDPDRSRRIVGEDGRERDAADAPGRFLDEMAGALAPRGGAGLHLLLRPSASPTIERLLGAVLRRFPAARVHRYGPLAETDERAASRRAFGQPVDLVFDFAAADAVLTLGGDPFAIGPGHVRYAHDYVERRRRRDRPLPRLVSVETCPSLVGARADERIPLRPREVAAFARAVLAALDGTVPADAHPAASRAAASLRAAGARGMVVAGPEQPLAVQVVAQAIHARLGALGTTVRAIAPVRGGGDAMAEIRALAEAIASGAATHLVVLGGNPAYDAPADLDFPALLRRVPESLYVGPARNETALSCRRHLPAAHPLESFGDRRAFDGTLALRQPACVRLEPSVSEEEVLSRLAGRPETGREVLEETWRERWAGPFEPRLLASLEAGIVPDSAFPPVAVRLAPDWDGPDLLPPPARPLDILFAPDPSVLAGEYSNNGWLQELPKPLTKQVWGNAALLAPATASAWGVREGDVLEVAAGGRRLRIPALPLPGHAPDALTLTLGYGRVAAGRIGNGIGVDAGRLRISAEPWIAGGEARPTGERARLVTSQTHHTMEGRPIVRTVVPGERIPPLGPLPSLYPEWRYDSYAWGMSVDLDACIGCNACTVACQAENNIPVVGPEEAALGREMHWIRVDRYYAGPPENPETFFQPVPCMHCEKAPCEVVCPVNATVHSSEGLNDMVYNRCIGTRTCSNNCPYKVRRFNFRDTRRTPYAVAADALNPQVTVRERGVMEKCTYCVQRIVSARIEARMEDRRVRDGDVVTACQSACPTRAITFGDASDPTSGVSREKANGRQYALLGELGTEPRTTYGAKVRPPAEGEGG